LGISVLFGILLAEPIVWLLFERGKFTPQDTLNTVAVLQMYMVGLVPFGLAKFFSMYLYAMHKHMKAAKIAVISLVVNMIFSVTLMQFMGASGLALAGSIGGLVQMILTIKEVGMARFIEIIKTKRMLYFIIGMSILGVATYYLNILLISFIRG